MHLSLITSDGDEAKCGCLDYQISKANISDNLQWFEGWFCSVPAETITFVKAMFALCCLCYAD